ncbi:hypothetical protein B0H15DRAFT_780506 [Mycena belliarum]|uniref:GATA-type domain-containing protein n=1 Tax=Mycena belliarum TaxID=1033014 RepID=A0AAD6U4A9_9AGAR|nr:hypothetical protein B0H15DRAFT_780506 [Mycena belliae]
MDHSYHNPWPSPSQYPPFALDAKYPPWHAPTQWNPSVGGSSLLLRPFPEYAPYPSPSSSTSSPPLPTYPLSAPPSPRRWGRGSLKDTSKDKQCAHCHATATPLWRREPATGRTLCNACGLYLQQRNKLRPQALIDADADDAADATAHIPDAEYVGPTCSHCGTRQTSVWRRSKAGARVCNACGVYARLRGKERPLSLRRNKVKPRTKHAR